MHIETTIFQIMDPEVQIKIAQFFIHTYIRLKTNTQMAFSQRIGGPNPRG